MTLTLLPKDLAVLRLYNAEGRHYHGVHHILEMLELHFTGKSRGVAIPNYVRPVWDEYLEGGLICAIIAHDCVYEIGREKGWNERQSFERWKEITGLRPYHVMEPAILATITHDPADVEILNPSHLDVIKHMIDLDMAPLGFDRDEFDVNSDNIRLEMIHGGIPPESYASGRNAFFKSVLAKDRIYHTEQFHNALEAKARANIQRVLDGAAG